MKNRSDDPERDLGYILLTLAWLLLIAAVWWPRPAEALTSHDQCSPPCEMHKLQWRPTSTDAWADVALLPTEVISHPEAPIGAMGVEWTGISTYGEFQVLAMRAGSPDSPYSPVYIIGEPPVAPLLLSSLAVIGYVRRRRRRR